MVALVSCRVSPFPSNEALVILNHSTEPAKWQMIIRSCAEVQRAHTASVRVHFVRMASQLKSISALWNPSRIITFFLSAALFFLYLSLSFSLSVSFAFSFFRRPLDFSVGACCLFSISESVLVQVSFHCVRWQFKSFVSAVEFVSSTHFLKTIFNRFNIPKLAKTRTQTIQSL